MLLLSPGSLVMLVLLAGNAGAAEPPFAPECSVVPRVDLTAELVDQALGTCVNPGAPTTFVFGTPLPPGSVVLSDSRSVDFAQGSTFITVYPKRSFLPGERVKMTVRFGDGTAPEEAAFWLVGHSAQGPRSVEVFRRVRSVDALQREVAEARADANRCQEEKAQLVANRAEPGGLMGAAWLERTGEIHFKDIFNDLVQHPDNALTVEAARSYSHAGSVAVRLKLLNQGSEPWAVAAPVLKDSTGAEVELSAWHELIIPPGARTFIVLGANKEPGHQFNCPCVLKLGEAQGPRTITLESVTFPPR